MAPYCVIGCEDAWERGRAIKVPLRNHSFFTPCFTSYSVFSWYPPEDSWNVEYVSAIQERACPHPMRLDFLTPSYDAFEVSIPNHVVVVCFSDATNAMFHPILPLINMKNHERGDEKVEFWHTRTLSLTGGGGGVRPVYVGTITASRTTIDTTFSLPSLLSLFVFIGGGDRCVLCMWCRPCVSCMYRAYRVYTSLKRTTCVV